MAEGLSRVAVVSAESQRGPALAFCGRERLSRCLLHGLRRMQIAARRLGGPQCFVNVERFQGGIRQLVRKIELLAQRQSDGARQGQLGNRKVVLRDAEVVFLRLQLGSGAGHVDARAVPACISSCACR